MQKLLDFVVKTPGDLSFELVNKYVDEIVTVDEDEIASAMLFERKCFLATVISDRPGALAQLLKFIASMGRKRPCGFAQAGNPEYSYKLC